MSPTSTLRYPSPIDFSAVQILIVLIIALLVFGPKRLPELGKQVGRGLRSFKSQMNEITDDVRTLVDDDPDPDAVSTPRPTTQPAVTAAAEESDDDMLDGVVVSGADGPTHRPPAER
mgnify:CR=1 FL=1